MHGSGIEIKADSVSVCRSGKLILHDVSFQVNPGTLTAIIGPNGAGKTTLMRALSGQRPDGGQILLDGEDLYTDPEYWLQRIGYVPVDNILHDHLTLHQSLLYVGQLRLPQVPLQEIEARVDKLLEEFDFRHDDKRRHSPIRVLSSGERKRANVCAELITDPPLLLLDEPTSNLDPDAERDLMYRLADYAHTRGRTILVITHTLNTIDACDDVIFIENSQLREFGPRQKVLEALEKDAMRMAADGTGATPLPTDEHSDAKEQQYNSHVSRSSGSAPSEFYRWATVFKAFKTKNEHKKCTQGRRKQIQDGEAATVHALPPTAWFHQLRCLMSRYLSVRLGDRWSLFGTLLAGASGILFFIFPANTFLEPTDKSELSIALTQARQSVYVIAIVVTLIGLITSYTEISKEFRIYKHERLKGLSPSAYFMSKWIWLTGMVGILAPILLLTFVILVYRQPFPGFPEPRFGEEVGFWGRIVRFQLTGMLTTRASWIILGTLILTCIASISLGLLISSLAGDSDKGYLYLSFTAVFIVLFSGLIRNDALERLVDTLSFLSTGRWAYEGFSANIEIYCWHDSWHFDEFNSTGHVISVWLSLGAYTLLCAFLAVTLLRARDPWYDWGRTLREMIARDGLRMLMLVSIAAVLLSYALFLRQQSRAYHNLNYFNRQVYGGTNSYEYANIKKVAEPDQLQYWNGKLSQSWCGDQ